jgi:hypothetical protein
MEHDHRNDRTPATRCATGIEMAASYAEDDDHDLALHVHHPDEACEL